MISPKKALREANVRPRKAWGQNFLLHAQTARRIVDWANLNPQDLVLEIGPGLGALTEALLQRGHRVWAVEFDPRLATYLETLWEANTQIRVMHADALKVDYARIAEQAGTALSVVANLPYHISTPILEKLLSHLPILGNMTLMFQEELVHRMTAQVGTKSYGRLSIWVQSLCDITRGFRIPRGSFYPVPDVESRLIHLSPRSSPLVPATDREDFFHLTALIFQQRRKTVQNALRKTRKFSFDEITNALGKTQIDPMSRPETIAIPQLLSLMRALMRK